MGLEVILLILLSLTPFGPVRSTDSILEIRQRRREQGDDPKIYS